MSKCNFSVLFSGSAEALIGRVNAEMQKANGKFEGDESWGVFNLSTPLGSIGGSYKIDGQMINLEINEKPIFISCIKIQSELQKILNG